MGVAIAGLCAGQIYMKNYGVHTVHIACLNLALSLELELELASFCHTNAD